MDGVRTAFVLRRWIEVMHRDREMYSTDIAEVLRECGWTDCASANVIGIFEGWDIQRLHTEVHDPRTPNPAQQSGLDW